MSSWILDVGPSLWGRCLFLHFPSRSRGLFSPCISGTPATFIQTILYGHEKWKFFLILLRIKVLSWPVTCRQVSALFSRLASSCHWVDKHTGGVAHFIKLNRPHGFYFNHNSDNELNIASCNNKRFQIQISAVGLHTTRAFSRFLIMKMCQDADVENAIKLNVE